MSKHKATLYMDQVWGEQYNLRNKKKPDPPVISHLDENELKNAISKDIGNYVVSGLISFYDALGRIKISAWSWSGVKLYYSMYYFARAYIGEYGYAMCILEKDLVYVKAKVNAPVKKPAKRHVTRDESSMIQASGSHGTVLYIMEHELKDDLLVSQYIDNYLPTEWMKRLRETFNYKNCGFPEPQVPEEFSKAHSLGLLSVLNAYFKDQDHYYAFDEDHAVIAYPLEFLKATISGLSQNEKDFILDSLDVNKDLLYDLLGGDAVLYYYLKQNIESYLIAE